MMILQIAEQAGKGIEKLFDTYVLFGVLGLLVISLIYACIKLYNRNEKLREDHSLEVKELNKIIIEKSEKTVVLLDNATQLLSKFPETLSLQQQVAQRELAQQIKDYIRAEAERIKAIKCSPRKNNNSDDE